MTVVVTSGHGPSLDRIVLDVPPEPLEVRGRVRDAVLGGADWREEFGEELGGDRKSVV